MNHNLRKKSFFHGLCLLFAFLITTSAYAQDNIRVVRGTVLDDATGETLIGVSVLIKGTSNGAATDINGNFTLSDVPANAVLVFSYLGFDSLERPAKSTVDVRMKESSKMLDEIIVIGYGTQRKADLTTAVASVSSDEWSNRPITSAQQALQGKAAGVQVIQPSGKPGVGMQIRVRGSSSLNAGNDPLYVVDGIQTNDISNIAPSDIENMQILKDASSTAIYGTRAANGVVLITTKKGMKGRTKIDVSMYAGFSNVSKRIKTLNTKQYYDLMGEVGFDVDKTNRNYTNWAKETYGTGSQQNYQVAISGGSDNTTYYLSGNYQKEDGIIKPADYNRYSFRGNISSDVTKWLKVSTNMSFARYTRQDVPDNKNSGRGGVIMSVLNTPPYLDIWDKDNPGQYAGNPFQPSNENPLAFASTYDFNKDHRFMGNIELDFSIIEGLHFKPSFSLDYTSHTWDKFMDPIKTQNGRQTNGKGEHANDDYQTWISENILTYSKRFDDKHNLSLLGGFTAQKYRHNNAYMSGEDYVKGTTYKVMTMNMANKINTAETKKEGNTLMSYLARAQYDYLSKYLLSASFRADGSSKLYDQWDYFPSVSAGWRFSSEEFFEPLTTVIDDSKIRVGYGRTGNQNGIADYDFYDKYSINKQGTIGNGPAVSPERLGNRDLKWEITTQYNAGLDLSFFNSRLVAEFDVYYKKTTDLLLQITLPSTVGVKLPLRNDGEMLNKGFEFNLNGQILTGQFGWDASLNMSFNKNEIKKLSLTPQFTVANLESNTSDVIMIRKGLPLGAFYGYISEGVNPETGDMVYRDLDSNGIINASDKTIIGDAQPDFTFGMTHNFSWKNLTLGAFFQGSYGNDIYNASRIDLEAMNSFRNQSTSVLNRWTRPGMITDIPRAGGVSENIYNSTRFVEDGSFIRLKSLTLAYNFDSKLIKPLGLSKLNVYGTVNNLFTLTKYRGYDPELSWTGDSKNTSGAAQLGIDMGTYPQTRSFIFGLNLTF